MRDPNMSGFALQWNISLKRSMTFGERYSVLLQRVKIVALTYK